MVGLSQVKYRHGGLLRALPLPPTAALVLPPQLLTMVQKARQAAEGGQLFCLEAPRPRGHLRPSYSTLPDGVAVVRQDVCVVSWLEGNVDPIACGNASSIGFPPVDAANGSEAR